MPAKTAFSGDKVNKHCRLLLNAFRFKSLQYTQFVQFMTFGLLISSFLSYLAWGVNGDA